MSKKIQISFNQYQYDLQIDLENNVKATYKQMQDVCNKALGLNKGSVFEMLEDKTPSNYLVNKYAEMYLQDYPQHLDIEKAFEHQTQVTIIYVDELKTQLNNYLNKMGESAPTINDAGITSNIKKSDFNIYVAEDKIERYNAVKDVLDAIDKLREFGGVGQNQHIVRALYDVAFDGLGVKITIGNFI